MVFPTVTGQGVSLVVTAVAAPLAVFLSWLEQHRAADRKAQQDAADREAARAAQLAAQHDVAGKLEAVRTLVDGHGSAMSGEIVALKDVISKGITPPQMPAAEAAPQQVTTDGGVVSVGKAEETKT